MKQDKTFFYILLIVIPLYFLQGGLFDHGSLASQSIVAVWLFIDIIYFIRYINYGLWEPIGRIIVLFWLLQTITWIVTPFFSDISSRGWGATYSVYKNISVVFLTYFPFYYFSYKSVVDEKQLKIFAVLSLLTLVAAFFISSREGVFNSGRDDITNNGAYYLIAIIPLLGLYFDKFIEFLFYGALLVLVLWGAKRGAILCATVEVLLFFYFYSRKSNSSTKLLTTVWVLVFIIGIVYISIDLFQDNDYLQQRYDQTVSGDSSMRDEIYSNALLQFGNQGVLNQLFGNGMNSTLSIIGGYAHQDWLELLIDNGFLGIFLYFSFFVTLFSYYRKKRKRMTQMERFIFLSATMGWFFRSMYSMGYFSIETSFFIMAFGYLSGYNKKINKKITCHEYISIGSR
jgi:hypothetical protein